MIRLINFFYDKLLKEETIIIKKKLELNKSVESFINQEEVDKELIAKTLKLKYKSCILEKLEDKEYNSFEIKDDLVYFYPPNDGAPTMPFYFYDNNKNILSNIKAYQEIKNLDDILLEMVNIFDYGVDNNIAFNPYRFMLELQKEDNEYNYEAKLVISDATIKSDRSQSTIAYYLNRFLDHFLGWNFGVSINKSKELEKKLLELNNKAIRKGLRQSAGPGFNVVGTKDTSVNGLQHYYLPTEYHMQKIKK